MNRIITLGGAAALALTLSTGALSTGAMAADTSCGAAPAPPAMPADGATASGKEMEAAATEYDAYQAKFIEVNNCMTKEFNATQQQFKALIDGYQAKNQAAAAAKKKK